MAIINNISAINSGIMMSASTMLSQDTIRKLLALGIDPKIVSSETHAKKLIQKAEQGNSVEKTAKTSTDEDLRLEKLYKRLKALCLKLGISISEEEKISNVLNKINAKITQLEQDKNNSDINAVKSEYEMIKLEYQNITTGQSSLLTGMDILSKNNRAIHKL